MEIKGISCKNYENVLYFSFRETFVKLTARCR